MARNIHGNYFEDTYIKHECQSCKRCFIVGEKLSEDMRLACPYCQSTDIEIMAASADDSTDDMGCLGLYYSLYDDGSLMLYTESEFVLALKLFAGGDAPRRATDCVKQYCMDRDGRTG